jgi:hypothetical protein
LPGHRLPRRGRSLVHESHHVVANDRAARVADAEEVPAVARRGDPSRARDRERDVLAAVLVTLQLRRHLHIHGQLADALANTVEQRGVDMLVGRWSVGVSIPMRSVPPAIFAKQTQSTIGDRRASRLDVPRDSERLSVRARIRSMTHRLRLVVPDDHRVQFELPEEMTGEVEITVRRLAPAAGVTAEQATRRAALARRVRERMPKNTGDSTAAIREERGS